MLTTKIRAAVESDHDQIWHIIKEVINSGDTYVFAPDTDRETMLAYWCGKDKYT